MYGASSASCLGRTIHAQSVMTSSSSSSCSSSHSDAVEPCAIAATENAKKTINNAAKLHAYDFQVHAYTKTS